MLEIYTNYTVLFDRPVPVSQCTALEEYVVNQAKKKNILSGLERSWACEGGFNLPITDEWKRIAIDIGGYFYRHSSRQLRFITQGNIITGLRYKDAVYNWSIDEINELVLLIKLYQENN